MKGQFFFNCCSRAALYVKTFAVAAIKSIVVASKKKLFLKFKYDIISNYKAITIDNCYIESLTVSFYLKTFLLTQKNFFLL